MPWRILLLAVALLCAAPALAQDALPDNPLIAGGALDRDLDARPVRAAAWLLAYQGVLTGVNGYLVRPPQWGPPRWQNFKEAFTRPPKHEDDDGWFVNLVQHPIMGAHFYFTGRNHGLSVPASIGLTFVNIATWEFLIESWFTRPVWLDLVTTPILGLAVAALLSFVKPGIRDIDNRWLRSLAMTPVDPVEAMDTLLFRGPPFRVNF